VIEGAVPPRLGPELSERMGATASPLEAIRYEGAGTLSFCRRDGNYFFLERTTG